MYDFKADEGNRLYRLVTVVKAKYVIIGHCNNV